MTTGLIQIIAGHGAELKVPEMDLSRDLERYAALAIIVVLVLGCYLVVRPFLTAFIWGAIVAISTQGLYARLLDWLGGRRALAATLTTLGLVTVLLVPIAALALGVADQWGALSERLSALLQGGAPPPPAWLDRFPLIGHSVTQYWRSVLSQPGRLEQDLRPLVRPVRDFLVSFLAGVGSGVLEFTLALVIAGLLYVWGADFGKMLARVADRLGGKTARRQLVVVESTVRGVFRGVIGTSAVQGLLAMFGFWVSGVPSPILLGMATFFLSVLPGGPILLWLPAALWLNGRGDHAWAIFLAVWGLLIVGSADNVVRPLLIGQGTEAPMVVIFLGVVGGVLAFGFLGLFIGPTLLAIAYNLLQDWIAAEA